MVILDAEVFFKKRSDGYDFYKSGIRVTVKIEAHGYYSEVRSLNGKERLPTEKKELMEVILFDGEIILSKLQEELVFEFISGKTVGYGVIKKIREIYITSESLNFIDDIEERRKIVRLAETMENALVFEDVYLMI